jgi:cyclopropane-fatty-acyl-phospholipid synthase
MLIADLLLPVFGPDLPVRIDCYDGSSLGPASATTRINVRSPEALSYLIHAPGELGFARAYVHGDIELEGDIFEALSLRETMPNVHFNPRTLVELAKVAGSALLHRPPVPREEIHLHGLLHSRARDAAAISAHYDVGNDFYRIVLGPSMTYSCAVWEDDTASVDQAQMNKYELICRKLALKPGMRLLDVGCGWGGMVRYAAEHYGVRAVGVTLSQEQATYATAAAKEAGLDDRVEIRVQDYRDIHDGPFDAISSIGMFEHVGLSKLGEYFDQLRALVSSEGRVLNHGISRTPGGRKTMGRRSFINRYVFPDGQLHEIGSVVSRMQQSRFEVRHVESLREHYALTLRSWVANLEANWDEAVRLVGIGRVRVWQLYMAASAVNFEDGHLQIHQTLAVPGEQARSGMPRRADWDTRSLSDPGGRALVSV